MKRRTTVLIALAVCAAAVVTATSVVLTNPPGAGPAAGRFQHLLLNTGGDSYRYVVYVPADYHAASGGPLVVVVHGCNTTADQQTAASGYDGIARQHRFVVLYPDVDPADQTYGGCWKAIWDPGTEGRGRGDAGAIAAMTRAVMAGWHIDRTRVYAIGISAGAFETAVLGAAYPDLYTAVGIHSGAAFGGGRPGCLAANQTPADTDVLARRALAAMGSRARVMPVIVLHGDQDNTIPYRCGREAVEQWLRTDDLILRHHGRPRLPSVPSISEHVVPGADTYAVASWTDRLGCPVAQLWTIHGMGHYWSGGSSEPASARYSDPRGPSASAASWAFFSRWRLSGPVAPCLRPGRYGSAGGAVSSSSG